MKVTIFNIITKKLFSLPAGTGTYCMVTGYNRNKSLLIIIFP